MVKVDFSIEDVKFDDRGLVPAIIQDVNTRIVLMLGYMNKEALAKTMETGRTWFWSRSRQRLWNKGETSGNYHDVVSISLDCDKDTLLVKVRPAGPTCHTGSYSCFDREEMSVSTSEIITEVYNVILERKAKMPEGSYVAKRMKEGLDKILKKVSEEAGEFIIASKNQSKKETVYELADLLFHSLLVLAYLDIPIEKLYEELRSRRK
ncbi:MAG: bifunctional phosphoribosyl-AMP cyclohydrolase/phosphoribosyl-ATP diphosphatase HisIE [Brevinematia bacterium]